MKRLQVATYNINCCRDFQNAFGDKSPSAVSDFIKHEKIDICGLNEVDINSERSLGYDQPRFIKERLEEITGEAYYYCFGAGLVGYHPPQDATYEPTDGKALYGNAIVSRYPILNYRTVKIAVKEEQVAAGGYEHRVLLIAEIDVDGEILTVISTHFGTTKEERLLAVKILEKELESIETPIIFMGDLNAGWNKEEIVSIEKLLKNTTVGGNMFTFDTINPRWQIDYIFTSEEFETENVRVPEILFSDHSPIVAGLKF